MLLPLSKERYWSATASRAHNGEAVFFYFLTVEDAKAFIDRFACGLSVPRRVGAARADAPGPV